MDGDNEDEDEGDTDDDGDEDVGDDDDDDDEDEDEDEDEENDDDDDEEEDGEEEDGEEGDDDDEALGQRFFPRAITNSPRMPPVVTDVCRCVWQSRTHSELGSITKYSHSASTSRSPSSPGILLMPSNPGAPTE